MTQSKTCKFTIEIVTSGNERFRRSIQATSRVSAEKEAKRQAMAEGFSVLQTRLTSSKR